MNRYALAAATAALSIVLASCSSSSKSTAPNNPPPAASGATAASASGIVISGFAFSGTMTVKAGQKVTVTNRDSVAHTVTDKRSHLFDTGSISGGGTGSFTAPNKPGSYPFVCTFHPNMHGTLIVQG